MTTLAPTTKPAAMNILPSVTAVASGRQADFFLDRLLMARFALQALMGPIQFKICLAVVIKLP
jgi:hypothetical protein